MMIKMIFTLMPTTRDPATRSLFEQVGADGELWL